MKTFKEFTPLNESVKGRIAFRRLFPAKSQKRFETKFPSGPPVKVSVKRPIGHTIADIGPGKKEYNVKTVKEEVQLNEVMTRKHFQQVADVIKAHPDATKREELAKHHAAIFKASNPRFDHKRFYSAANVVVKEEAEYLDEALTSSHGTADGHSHKVKSSYANGKFSGTIHTSHRDNRYSYTGPEARSPVEHEKPKTWTHAVKHGLRPSDIRKKNPHLDQTQAAAVSRHFEEHKNKVRQISEGTKGIPGLEHLDAGDAADKSWEKQERARGPKKPKVKRISKDAIYKSLGMTKVKGALGGTYYEGVEKWRTLDNPMQTKSVPKYQVGSTVKPKIGPHKGTNHTVIHVHADGSYNIKPEVHVSSNRYRQGAARAQEKDLE